MNVVKEIAAINARELASGSSASWHDQYKDSAYIYVGGLPHQLTEGDVITIFSQYGEIVDISLPRDQTTQKPKGFAFLMYADQRSTVLAVDNLGGSKVLERTLRVDHVLNYKQLKRDEESGKMVEREVQSLAAHPDNFKTLKQTSEDSSDAESAASSHPSIDIDDPMRDYLIRQSREKKRAGGTKRIKGGKKEGKGGKEGKRDRKDESKEERKERRERKKMKLGLLPAPPTTNSARQITNEEEKGKGRETKMIEEKRFSGDSRRVGGVREKAVDSYEETAGDRRTADGGGRRDERENGDSRRTDDRRRDEYSSRDRTDDVGDSDSRRRDSRRDEDRRGDSRRDDRSDRDRSERRDRERDEQRHGEGRDGKRGNVSAFADLEKWAKGA